MARLVEVKEQAAEICERFELGTEARKLLRPGLSAKEFLNLLDAHQLFADGIRFVAYAFPSREAIWWGSLCTWSIYRPKPPDKIASALNAVVAWVQEPSEDTRRAAEAAMEPAGMDTPAGGLAAAVFFAGDNIAPAKPKQPEVKPKPFLWSKILAGAVGSAAKQAPPDKKKQWERQFLSLAADVAEGRTHWEPRTSQGERIVRPRRR
jgi:hypothetical protein